MLRALCPGIVLVAGLALICRDASAGGVVGNGTPASCTESAFQAALAGGGTVSFDCGGGPVTVSITSTRTITVSTTIDGTGQQITLDGGGTTRLFVVPWVNGAAVVFRLRSLTLRNARAADVGAAIKLDHQDPSRATQLEIEDTNFLDNVAAQAGNDVGGGAIYSGSGTNLSGATPNRMTIRRCLFRGNRGGNGGAIGTIGGQFTIEDTRFENNQTHEQTGENAHGGALYVDGSSGGPQVLRRVSFVGNQAAGLGGAIHAWMYGLPSSMSIEDSVFVSNLSGSNGGAVFHMNGRLDVARSAFHDNAAFAQGGALWVRADGARPGDTPVTVANTTFYRNRASGCSTADNCWAVGGAIANSGASSLTLSHVTIAGNSAGWTGGGIASGSTNVSVRASIIASNSAANPYGISHNCTNTLPDAGFSLEWPGPATTNWNDYPCGFTRLDPRLGALSEAGTSHATLPPLPGSPAIDRVSNGCPPPSTDQRGTPRPQAGGCDSGAHEDQPSADVWVALQQAGGAAMAGRRYTYTVTAANTGPLANPTVLVQVDFPSEAASPPWSCVPAGGATCPAPGAGDIGTSLNLPAGASVTFTASGSWIDPGAKRQLVASVSASSAVADPVLANNSAVLTTAVEHRSRFHTVQPCRLVDTREAVGPRGGPALAGGQARSFPMAGACGIPVSAWALSLNVTVVGAEGAGHITLYPAGMPRPLASSLNFTAGRARANNAAVSLDAEGTLAVFTTHDTHLVIDVTGYYE
jgi:hypothetical protein